MKPAKESLMNAVRCFVLLVLLPLPSMAQRAALRGRVTDESGGVIPAAIVVLNGPAGVKSTKTGVDGNYAFPDLPPGDYTLRASAPKLIVPTENTIAGENVVLATRR